MEIIEIKKNIEKIPSYDSSSDNENMQTAILNRNLSDSIEDDISTLFQNVLSKTTFMSLFK